MEVLEDWEFLAHQILTGSTDMHAGNSLLNSESPESNKEAVHLLQTYTSILLLVESITIDM